MKKNFYCLFLLVLAFLTTGSISYTRADVEYRNGSSIVTVSPNLIKGTGIGTGKAIVIYTKSEGAPSFQFKFSEQVPQEITVGTNPGNYRIVVDLYSYDICRDDCTHYFDTIDTPEKFADYSLKSNWKEIIIAGGANGDGGNGGVTDTAYQLRLQTLEVQENGTLQQLDKDLQDRIIFYVTDKTPVLTVKEDLSGLSQKKYEAQIELANAYIGNNKGNTWIEVKLQKEGSEPTYDTVKPENLVALDGQTPIEKAWKHYRLNNLAVGRYTITVNLLKIGSNNLPEAVWQNAQGNITWTGNFEVYDVPEAPSVTLKKPYLVSNKGEVIYSTDKPYFSVEVTEPVPEGVFAVVTFEQFDQGNRKLSWDTVRDLNLLKNYIAKDNWQEWTEVPRYGSVEAPARVAKSPVGTFTAFVDFYWQKDNTIINITSAAFFGTGGLWFNFLYDTDPQVEIIFTEDTVKAARHVLKNQWYFDVPDAENNILGPNTGNLQIVMKVYDSAKVYYRDTNRGQSMAAYYYMPKDMPAGRYTVQMTYYWVDDEGGLVPAADKEGNALVDYYHVYFGVTVEETASLPEPEDPEAGDEGEGDNGNGEGNGEGNGNGNNNDENTAVETNPLQSVNIYPNPNDGTFIVKVPVTCTVEIFNAVGTLVQKRENVSDMCSFELRHSGAYFMRATAGRYSVVKRIVVR